MHFLPAFGNKFPGPNLETMMIPSQCKIVSRKYAGDGSNFFQILDLCNSEEGQNNTFSMFFVPLFPVTCNIF